MKALKIALLFLTLTGCAMVFTRVDFKYSNLAHMNYRNAMTEISCDPEDLVFDLSQAFRRNGANVLERTKLNFILSEKADAQRCWEAQYEIFQKEFATYRVNNFRMYQSIDRVSPFMLREVSPNCHLFENVVAPDADSWFLLVELPPKTSQATIYTPTVDDFFLFGSREIIQGISTSYVPKRVAVSISTRLYLWAWRESKDQRTRVYLLAKPVNGQVEANAGKSIGYRWWEIANGYSEQQTVKNYIALIQEYDRRKISE